jgi:hypothetical protein
MTPAVVAIVGVALGTALFGAGILSGDRPGAPAMRPGLQRSCIVGTRDGPESSFPNSIAAFAATCPPLAESAEGVGAGPPGSGTRRGKGRWQFRAAYESLGSALSGLGRRRAGGGGRRPDLGCFLACGERQTGNSGGPAVRDQPNAA